MPMAGKGQRFIDAGYEKPKPLVDVCGIPMIELVLKSVDFDGKYIFITLMEHMGKGLKQVLERTEHDAIYYAIKNLTEGAVCTVLLTKREIDNDDELLIANCDQYLDFDPDNFLTEARKADGCIMTFNSTNPHHSYAKVKDGKVIETAEKKVISDHASAGLYYFKHGLDFVKAAEEMIKKNIRTNNEFYIAPVFNELIRDGKIITHYEIDVKDKHMLGTPDELHIFEDKVQNGLVSL
jgi:NDP-sugar pyrophosphorylase family protein